MEELLIAANPDPDSRLPYLLRLPLGGGMVFRSSGTWPRTKALYCHPMPLEEWPAQPVIVERVALRSCRRRGAAIDLVAGPSPGEPVPAGVHHCPRTRGGVLAVAADP